MQTFDCITKHRKVWLHGRIKYPFNDTFREAVYAGYSAYGKADNFFM